MVSLPEATYINNGGFAPLRGGAATVSLAVVREALDVLIRIPVEDSD